MSWNDVNIPANSPHEKRHLVFLKPHIVRQRISRRHFTRPQDYLRLKLEVWWRHFLSDYYLFLTKWLLTVQSCDWLLREVLPTRWICLSCRRCDCKPEKFRLRLKIEKINKEHFRVYLDNYRAIWILSVKYKYICPFEVFAAFAYLTFDFLIFAF